MAAARVPGTYLGDHRRGNDGIVDEIAVERAMQGDPSVRLTADERRAAVAGLKRRGVSHLEIARRLGLADRSVVRIAGKLRTQGVLTS